MNAAATARLEVAETILAQLGGRRFMMMTGAVVMGDANSLTVRFKGSDRANRLVVTLEPNDTYTMKFFKVRGTACREIASLEMVYADSLQSAFTRITGLYTSL